MDKLPKCHSPVEFHCSAECGFFTGIIPPEEFYTCPDCGAVSNVSENLWADPEVADIAESIFNKKEEEAE